VPLCHSLAELFHRVAGGLLAGERAELHLGHRGLEGVRDELLVHRRGLRERHRRRETEHRHQTQRDPESNGHRGPYGANPTEVWSLTTIGRKRSSSPTASFSNGTSTMRPKIDAPSFSFTTPTA